LKALIMQRLNDCRATRWKAAVACFVVWKIAAPEPTKLPLREKSGFSASPVSTRSDRSGSLQP